MEYSLIYIINRRFGIIYASTITNAGTDEAPMFFRTFPDYSYDFATAHPPKVVGIIQTRFTVRVLRCQGLAVPGFRFSNSECMPRMVTTVDDKNP